MLPLGHLMANNSLFQGATLQCIDDEEKKILELKQEMAKNHEVMQALLKTEVGVQETVLFSPSKTESVLSSMEIVSKVDSLNNQGIQENHSVEMLDEKNATNRASIENR